MRLTSIEVTNIPPIKCLSVEELSDIIVIAGPNGVGKTRLIEGLIQKFQQPTGVPNIRIIMQCTTPEERAEWGQGQLDSSIPEQARILLQTLQKNRRRRSLQSSVVKFESDRSIQPVGAYSYSWDIIDPWQEDIRWDVTFSGLRGRFQDTIHSIFRKIQSQRNEIAKHAEKLRREGQDSMPLTFSDPLLPFKEAFSQLLAPKRLLDAEPRTQQLKYELDGEDLPINSLSSGEGEVVNIVFDFILRRPSDCIIFFDEPELHLHPELSYKLLQTLRSIGQNNQFIFCTHSPDIITASLDQSVIFLSPAKQDDTNQAVVVNEDDETNQALRLLGQSIGIVSLGKRIVLIEGSHSSLDKQIYGTLLKNQFPDLVLVPTGGKEMIRSFGHLVDHVLDRTIWGIDFFMLCDRDAMDKTNVRELEMESKGRLRFLSKYHLENYFLDAEVLASIFEEMERDDSELRDPNRIEQMLREIAKSNLSYATALIVSTTTRRQVGNVDLIPKGCDGKSSDELVALFISRAQTESTRIMESLELQTVEESVRQTFSTLSESLHQTNSTWATLIPGRPIFNQFANKVGLDPGRLKLMYLNKVIQQKLSIFDDVISIFRDFSNC